MVQNVHRTGREKHKRHWSLLTSSVEGHFIVFYFCSVEAEFFQMPGDSFQLQVCPCVLGMGPVTMQAPHHLVLCRGGSWGSCI